MVLWPIQTTWAVSNKKAIQKRSFFSQTSKEKLWPCADEINVFKGIPLIIAFIFAVWVIFEHLGHHAYSNTKSKTSTFYQIHFSATCY